MKKFKFKLEKYLTYKKFQEKLCMVELAKALEPMNRHQENENRYISLRDESLLALSTKMTENKLDSEELRYHDSYFNQLKRSQEISLIEAKKMEPKMIQERKKFQTAHNAVRVLELIRDKQYGRYLIEQNRIDEQETNEMNTRRYAQSHQKKV